MENLSEIEAIAKLDEIGRRLAGCRGNIPQFFYVDEIGRKQASIIRAKLQAHIANSGQQDEIDVILNSRGGDPDAAYFIIKILRSLFAKVNIVVPYMAKSAATLLSLGASEIILDSFGEFGPLDTQVLKERNDNASYKWETALADESSLEMVETKAKEQFAKLFLEVYHTKEIKIDRTELSKQIFHHLAEFYSPLLQKIDPYQMGANNRNLSIAESYGKKILRRYVNQVHNPLGLIKYLAHQCPHHGYIIDEDELRIFGLNVKTSDEISAEYEKILRELSDFFFEYEEEVEISYIGFVSKSNGVEQSIRMEGTQLVGSQNGNKNGTKK